MPAKTHSKDMEEALKFFGLNDVPGSIKDLNSMYRKLSLKHHPDKNAGSDESTILYQHLQNYYKLIGDFVISNDTPNKFQGLCSGLLNLVMGITENLN